MRKTIWLLSMGLLLLPMFGFRCGSLIKECLSTEDCPARSTCLQSICIVTDPPECTTHNDCASNQQCVQGDCQDKPTSCTSDKDCSRTQTCQADICKPALPCQTDNECSSGQTCQDKLCLPCVASIEACDQKDNDCDGQIDEGCCQNDGDCQSEDRCIDGKCRNPEGKCTDSSTCLSGYTCQSGTCKPCTPVDEICDNKDNDCDGQIDEDVTESCYTGPAYTRDRGTCKSGVRRCIGGSWGACQGEVTPQPDKCGDKLDNNCDGFADEDCSTGTQDLFDWCNDTDKRCKAGLLCHANVCQQRCDLQNSKCEGASGDYCEQRSAGGATYPLCKRKCTKDEQCPTSMLCEAVKGLYCIPNRIPQAGPKGKNETCDRSETSTANHCNGSANLTCVSGRCKEICDPRETTSTCPNGEFCYRSVESPKGGFCGS